jgi:hypothetical protein
MHGRELRAIVRQHIRGAPMNTLRTYTFLVLALAAAAVFGQADRSHLANVSIEQLKQAYLECDRRSSRAVLDASTAKSCSLTAEELLQRGFAGSFEQLLAWWRSEARREERVVTDPPAPRREVARPAV